MSPLSIVILSLGLAMDATAVSVARGASVRVVRPIYAVKLALFFGGFQAFMAALGWLMGASVGEAVQAWDHWIAFTLLAMIGGKMIWDTWGDDGDEAASSEQAAFGLGVLTVLAIATSIDAFGAGVSLPMLGAPLLFSLASIGFVAALLSVVGLLLGRQLGRALESHFERVGGGVLIGLGVWILFEHLG